MTTVPTQSRLEPSDRTGWFLRICITLTTVLFLAIAVRDNLSYLFHFNNQEQSTFTIQALASKDANQELLIRAIISDGQLLRENTVERIDNFELIERGFKPPLFLYREDSKPAGLTLQGKNLVIVLNTNQWSGVIRMERDGREVKVVNLQVLEEQKRPIVLENPEAPPSLVLFVGALILFAVCAWWFGPIRTGRRNILWLTFFLFIIHFLFWTSQCVATLPDSPGYLQSASIFFHEGWPSYFPPGYPALLQAMGSFSGNHLGRWVTLVQHGMLVLGGVWIYLLLRRIMSDELALLGGILAGALAPSLTASQVVLSEAPTLFAMAGAFYFTVRSAETGKLLFAILAGLLTGWAGILRISPLAALLPSICIVHLLHGSKGRFRWLSITLAITAVVILIPILWCWHKSGQPKLTNSLGLHLFNRVVEEQMLLDENGPATRTLLTLLEGKDPRGVPHWEIIKQAELSYTEAEPLFREVALEGIRKDPWGFLVFTPHLTWNMLLTYPFVSAWGETAPVFPNLENPPPLMFTASSLEWRLTLEEIHGFLWPIICWLAIAGTFLGLLLLPSWIPTGYLLSTAFVERFAERYNSAVFPFVVALSMVPVAMALTFISLKRTKIYP
jgi:hypothetical protein